MSEKWSCFNARVLNSIAGNVEARGEATILCREIITRRGYRHLDATIRAHVDDDDLWGTVNLKIEQRWRRFTGKTAAEFYCWVRTILDRVRRKLENRYVPKGLRDPEHERRKDAASVALLLETMASNEPSPDQVAESVECEYLLRRALKRLTAEERGVVQLWMDGVTLKEIAAIVDKSHGAVRGIWRSARNRLRGELRACA